MIPPSFSLTATERVLPKLALDFTTATLDPRVTFTRAGDTATVVNSSGFIENVLANVPRFDFDPITFTCKGLLIEETRANLLTDTTTFATTWTAFGSSLSTGSVTSPAGSATSIKYVESSGVAEHGIFQTTSTTGSHAYSVFAKSNGRRYLVLRKDGGGVSFAVFDLDAGAVTQTQNSTATIQPYANGWYRCILVTTVLANGNTIIKSSDIGTGVNPNSTYNGDGVSGFYLYGAQLENGAFPTSYIPTTTTSLTRNADVATMTGTNFSSWFNASEGSFFVGTYSTPSANGFYFRAYVAANGATANDSLYFHSNPNTRFVVFSGASATVTDTGAKTTFGTTMNLVGAYKVNSFAAAKNAAATVTNVSGGVPVTSPDKLAIGSTGENALYVNGWITKLMYWPQRLTNVEVQAFSK